MHKMLIGAPVVLLYHRIGRPKLSSLVAGQYVCPGLFRSGLDYLTSKSWRAATLEDIVGNRCDGNQFAITFDDGYQSVYEHAYPAMVERHMTGTVYVVSGAIGGINEWDSRAGDTREPMMSTAQVREMSDAGFEIGAHTVSHPRLTLISDDQLEREIVDSKHALEDIIGREVVSFAYPYGDRDERVIEAVKAAGYKYAVSTRLGVANLDGVFEIPRVNVRWNALGWLLMRKIWRARRASGIAH